MTLWAGAEEPDDLQVSIFDVSDLTDPQLVDRYTFGGGYSTVTPATGGNFFPSGNGDHHAVGYFEDAQVFALPIHTLEGYSGWWEGTNLTPLFEAGEGGLQVFHIDVDAGFETLGVIEHDDLIKRSLQIGEHLIAISDGTVSMHELTNPTNELGRISLDTENVLELSDLATYQPVESQIRESVFATAFEIPSESPSDGAVRVGTVPVITSPPFDAGLQSTHSPLFRPASRGALGPNLLQGSRQVDDLLVKELAVERSAKKGSSTDSDRTAIELAIDGAEYDLSLVANLDLAVSQL
jgi:hypothetical protein